LTKQPADETTLKCHMTVETKEVSKSVTKIMDNSALVICDVNASIGREEILNTKPIKTGPEANRLGRIMPELYNLENCITSEKPVKINVDLELYQMENF